MTPPSRWLFFPTQSSSTTHVTYTKAEDSATPLVVVSGQGWWRANSSYSLVESVTYSPASTNSNYPRIRPGTFGSDALVLIDIRFGNNTDRDNMISELGTGIKLRVTIVKGGSTYVATSDTLAALEAAYGGTNTGADPTKDNNPNNLRNLSMSFFQNAFTGGTPTVDTTNGFGHNLGWDADMGVTIELFTP